MTGMQLAEGFVALAVREVCEAHFPHVEAAEKAELYQRLRAPILAAVVSYAAATERPRSRRMRMRSLEPSSN